MGGNPIKACLIFIIGWLILLIPLLRLTGERSQAALVVDQESNGNEMKAWADLRFTQPPLAFSIRQGDKMLWSGTNCSETELETQLLFHVEHERTELLVEAQWPDAAGSQVLELTLEPDERATLSRHAWAEPALDDIMVFDWSRP